MNLSILQKIIASSLCGCVTLIAIIVPAVTGNDANKSDDLTSTEETNDVYMYARGNKDAPKKSSTKELNHETKNFKCRYNNQKMNCEISQIKTNNKKWYLASKIALLDKKIKVADLRDTNNIFQIKLLASDWSKITETKTTFMDIVDDSESEHAYLEPLFSKYKTEIKRTFNHFVAKLVESKGNVNLKDTNFKCKFDNTNNSSNSVGCHIHSFNNEDKILNSKKYLDIGVFTSTEEQNWQIEKLYLISFMNREKITPTKTEIYFLKGTEANNSLKFEVTDKKIFFDKTISDHIFIL